MVNINSLIIVTGLIVVLIFISKLGKVQAQEITSPERIELGGLRSTSELGLTFEKAIANLRDNLTFGGLLFQG